MNATDARCESKSATAGLQRFTKLAGHMQIKHYFPLQIHLTSLWLTFWVVTAVLAGACWA